MGLQHILKRLRKELRSNPKVQAKTTILLQSDKVRKDNNRIAAMLIKKALHDQVEVAEHPIGFVVACREEIAARNLQAYTNNKPAPQYESICSTLTAEDLQTAAHLLGMKPITVFIPDSNELEMIANLSVHYPEIRRAA